MRLKKRTRSRPRPPHPRLRRGLSRQRERRQTEFRRQSGPRKLRRGADSSRRATACTWTGRGASLLNGPKAMRCAWTWSNTTRNRH